MSVISSGSAAFQGDFGEGCGASVNEQNGWELDVRRAGRADRDPLAITLGLLAVLYRGASWAINAVSLAAISCQSS